MGVPTFYVTAAADRRGLDARGHASTCGCSSRVRRRCSPRRTAHWQERTGHAILERYGMTETSMNTSNPYDGERVAGTVGLSAAGG